MRTTNYTYKCDGANCTNSTTVLDATWTPVPSSPAPGQMASPNSSLYFCAACAAKTTIAQLATIQQAYATAQAAAQAAAAAARRAQMMPKPATPVATAPVATAPAAPVAAATAPATAK